MESFGFEGLNELVSSLNSALGNGAGYPGLDMFAMLAVFVAGIIAVLIGL